MTFEIKPFLIVVLVVSILNGLLAFSVIAHNKGRQNQIFFLLVFSTIVWSISNYLAEISTGTLLPQLTVSITYAAAIMIAAIFFHFCLIFPIESHALSRRAILFSTYAVGLLFAALSFTPLIVSDVRHALPINEIESGPALIIYTVTFLVFIVSGVTILISKITKTKGAVRQQLKIVLAGVILTITGASFTNLLVPLTGNFELSRLGPSFTFFLVALTAYAILRHKLFEPKVIGAEFITASLSAFLLAKVFLSYGQERILNLVIFLMATFTGFLLVRSVIHEVERRKEIERLNKQLSDFLRFGTHELRSPLGAIRGYTSMVLEGSFGKITDGLQRTVRIIQTEIDRLLLLVETFLDANRARSGRLEVVLEPTDVASAIRRVLDTQKAGLKLKGLALNVSIADNLPDVVADPRKVQIIFGNVISNAVKYTLKGSVTINARADEHCVTVSVIDTGIGIPKEVIPQLFTQFERGTDRAKRVATGSGIGLYLTKKLVDAMDAEISISSPGPEKGSTVTLRFKCWKAAHPVTVLSK
jgi:signal transduction histidine kinase